MEQLFRDDKSKRNGWSRRGAAADSRSLRDTQITKPDRLDRLLLILAIAYLLLCGVGLIADRGADTFEFLQYLHEHDWRYVIRCARDRRLAGEDHVACDRIHQMLHGYTRDLPTLGEQTIAVPRQQKGKRKPKRDAREARVRMPL